MPTWGEILVELQQTAQRVNEQIQAGFPPLHRLLTLFVANT
jgi:hypothetical protein